MYRIEIDRSLCSGMASCVKIAPGTFDLDGEGIALVVTDAVDEAALEAAECCPFGAISVTEEASGRRAA
jgi:ferredoxin